MNSKIEKIITKFAEEWRSRPTLWLQEIDIQFEIFKRLKENLVLENITAKHTLLNTNEVYEFSALTLEPYIRIHDINTFVKPDIVIWDGTNSNESFINEGNFPIYWVCEIKYIMDEKNISNDDCIKLNKLLESKSIICKYALEVVFVLSKSNYSETEKISRNDRFTKMIFTL